MDQLVREENTFAAPAGGGSAFGGKTVLKVDQGYMYWIYVLRSLRDNNLYIGSTSDIDKRISYHNAGKVRSTKSRKPFELLYKEQFSTVTEARKRENFLKSGQGRKFLKEKFKMEAWPSG